MNNLPFDLDDVRSVQAQRPDLTDDQACEVLGFLNDTYADQSFSISDTARLFKDTANYIFPLEASC